MRYAVCGLGVTLRCHCSCALLRLEGGFRCCFAPHRLYAIRFMYFMIKYLTNFVAELTVRIICPLHLGLIFCLDARQPVDSTLYPSSSLAFNNDYLVQ